MALEVLGGVLAVVLFAITYCMFWAGLAGTVGVLRLRRCRSCGHLAPSTRGEVGSCTICRHQRAAHLAAPWRLRHYLPQEW